MKKSLLMFYVCCLLLCLGMAGPALSQQVFINEIHYDNASTDIGEAIEIAGPAGTDLAGWSLVLYNGSNGASYNTRALTGTLTNQSVGYGFAVFNYPSNGIQNGSPDGVALVDAAGKVVQFLSYEGTFAAVGGPADGMTSTDIGVSQPGSGASGQSLQLTGTGATYSDFTWVAEATSTYEALNNNQVFIPEKAIVFINEIHYDNDGTDAGEAIEIAGTAGTDLSGWKLILYNGSGGAPYNTTNLSGIIPNKTSGYGFVTVTYPANGIQNGAPDGVALVDADEKVVQFLSYEGAFSAVGGPADGMMSTDIGVAEPGTTPVGFSLQLTGTGSQYADFTWSGPVANTFTGLNTGQSFGGGTTTPDPEPIKVTIAEARALPIGTDVIINGTLTAADELGGPAYIQDRTGGIAVFDSQVHGPDAFQIGDSIHLTASIGAFNQMKQLVDVTDVVSYGAATTPIQPKVVTIANLTSAQEGELVSIPNTSFTDVKGLLFPESNYTITDGTGTFQLRIDADVESLVGREIPDDATTITGVVGSFRGTLQIFPRFLADLPNAPVYVAAGSDIPISRTLDVMTWNMEFFGSTLKDFGPSDVQLQLQNAVELFDSVDADIIAVQEISDENLLQQLADQLGYVKVCSDRFSYSFIPSDGTFPDQKLCFLYNPAVITLVDERVIFEALYDAELAGGVTPLDDYPTGEPTSFWSSGRLPYMITVDATIDGVTERINLINIHAKSGSGNTDLIRRRYDIQALNDTLSTYYPDANIILLGDYNDDVDVSIGGGTTTYSSFVNAEDFRVVTSTLSEAGLRSFITQDNVIDHIAISNELYDNYLTGSAQLVLPFGFITNYVNTTSDHLAVLTRYEFYEPLMVNAGADRVAYKGYAPAACVTLTASTATGGSGSYTYTWSNGEIGQSITVCPDMTTVYTVTVTDSRGNRVTDALQVCVIDVTCGTENNPKVQVYHNPSGKTGKGKVLCIAMEAVPAHLANGATLGTGEVTACGTTAPMAAKSKNMHELRVYPNPVSNYLKLNLDSKENLEVEVSMYNKMGVEVYRKSHMIRNGKLELNVQNVNLSKGVNYLKINSIHGTQSIRIIRE